MTTENTTPAPTAPKITVQEVRDTLHVLFKKIDHSRIKRGQEIVLASKVTMLHLENTGVLTACVLASETKKGKGGYQVKIDLINRTANCECDDRANRNTLCKHIAATGGAYWKLIKHLS